MATNELLERFARLESAAANIAPSVEIICLGDKIVFRLPEGFQRKQRRSSKRFLSIFSFLYWGYAIWQGVIWGMFLPPFSWLAVVIFWVLCLFFFRYVVQSLSEVTLQQQSHLFTLDTQTRQLRIHKPKGDTVIDIEEIRYFLSWRRHDEEATGAETALRVITRRRNQVLLTTDRPTEFARLLGFLCKKPAYERAYPGKHQLLRYAQEEEALLLPASAPAPLQEELLRPAAERAEAGPEQLLRPTVPEGDL